MKCQRFLILSLIVCIVIIASSSSVKAAGWNDAETWTTMVSGARQNIRWNPNVTLFVPGYGTYIGFSNYTYFDNFTWNIANNSIIFTNIYMNNGSAIPTFTCTLIGGNVTFTQLDYLNAVDFTFNSTVGSTVSLYLQGLTSIPVNVTIDGDPIAQGSTWNWDGSSTFIISYVMTSTQSRVSIRWVMITTGWHDAESWSVGLNPPGPTIVGVDYYFESNTVIVNNLTGYEMRTSAGSSLASSSVNLGVSSDPVQFGFTVFIMNSRGQATMLIDNPASAMVSRSTIGEGYQSVTADIGDYVLALGKNTVAVSLWIRLEGGAWVLSANFTTQRLMYTAVSASTWQFNLYVKTETVAGNMIASAYWGNSTVTSGIAGVKFIEPTPQELALYYAENGDFIHAFLYPFMIYSDYAVYGGGLLYVFGVLYLRHKKWEVILAFLFLFGGTQGIGLLIPDAAYRLMYAVVALALTWLLIRVFK